MVKPEEKQKEGTKMNQRVVVHAFNHNPLEMRMIYDLFEFWLLPLGNPPKTHGIPMEEKHMIMKANRGKYPGGILVYIDGEPCFGFDGVLKYLQEKGLRKC